jgi:hypothetical protein
MARKKAKRYGDGGEIVVSGSRAEDARMLDRMMREPSFVGGGSDFGGGGMGDGMGGSMGGGSRAPLPAPAPAPSVRFGKTYSPVGKVYGPRYTGEGFNVSGGYNPQSKVAGGRYQEEGFSAGLGYDPRRNYVGGDVSFSFKKGGKITAKSGKVKKMAKGGSTASKRADGCATQGKTKGRFV